MTSNNFKNLLEETRKHGVTMTKERLLKIIQTTTEREFSFVSDNSSKWILVRLPVRDH